MGKSFIVDFNTLLNGFHKNDFQRTQLYGKIKVYQSERRMKNILVNTGDKVIRKEQFPDCFPDNFYELIEENGIEAKSECFEEEGVIYRISKLGKLDRDAFRSTYEEYEKGLATNKDIDLNDLQTYSTSCDIKKAKIKKMMKLFNKYYPKPILLQGKAQRTDGIAMKTIDWKAEYNNNHHVDWWIYKEAHPETYFEECVD